MKNHYNIYIALLVFYLLGHASCIKEYPGSVAAEEQGSVIITMEIYNSVTSKATAYSLQDGVLGGAEYIIDKLRIYVFNSDGSLEKMEISSDLAADQVVQQTIEVSKDTSKELYFIANEPSDLTASLNAISSAEELEALEYTIAEAMNQGFNGAATFSKDDFLTPMTANYSVKNAAIDLNIYVGLTRAVARVDLYLDKSESALSRSVELDSSTKFIIDGLTYSSLLLPAQVGAPQNIVNGLEVASSDIVLSGASSDLSTSQRVLSFYLAERTYDYSDSASSITIELEGLKEEGTTVENKSVTLGDTGTLTEINRNYVYRIYGSYNGSEIVSNDIEIIDWTDVEVDGEIEGVMVAVDSEVAMDWLLNGNTYASKSISFGSNKPISFYLPVVVSSESDPTPEYEFTLFEFEDMSAGKSYDLKKIDLANNYIFATSWIESATIYFTSSQSGYIEFVYTPVKVSYKIQSYPIRIKSDNVTKQMKAVYDNGYLPSTLLSDDWAKRAPGGVVFAKRGEANHPLTTPEILYRDEDGYYRGEYATTAEEGSTYCSERFGDGWYMPSYADMIEIATMFDMLGVSYRFQNNGSAEESGELTESPYWTSSASSTYPGMYWSADFMSREYMIENLMERRDGSQSHFVRCVMDLQ